jgi:hypothetical protein
MKKTEEKIIKNFTIISNDVIKQLYAHPEAMVLYMYLATNSEKFLLKKNKSFMMKDTELNDRGWRKASKKLTEMGLLGIERVSDGKTIGSQYTFYNVPQKDLEIEKTPDQPKESKFSKEEWKEIHSKKESDNNVVFKANVEIDESNIDTEKINNLFQIGEFNDGVELPF